MPRFRVPAVVLLAVLSASCISTSDPEVEVEDDQVVNDTLVQDGEAFDPGICESYAMWAVTADAFPGDEPDESIEQADQSASTTALAELGQANDGDLPEDVHLALGILGDPDAESEQRDRAESVVKDYFGPECGDLGEEAAVAPAVAPQPGGVLNLDGTDHDLDPGCHTASAGSDRFVMNADSVGPEGAELEITTTTAGFSMVMTMADGEQWTGTSSTPAVAGADNLSGATLLDGPGGSEADSSFILNDVSALLPCAG